MEDKLITLQELANMCGVKYRTLMESRTAGRFLLPVVQISARTLRVRLSDANAVLRGERQLWEASPLRPEAKAKLRASRKPVAK